MAPEQFRNAKSVDVRCDIYSLGATLYAMVTGQIPFENASPLDCWMKKIKNEFPPPRELNREITERVDWAIRRAMSAEPDRRPASCREFLEDLTGQSRTKSNNSNPLAAGIANDVWYMVYKDDTGTTHTVKGSTEGIRKALREAALGDVSTILISRTKTGHFQSLASVPEFRDLVVNPAPLPAPGQRGKIGSGVLTKASGVVPQPGSGSRGRKADEVDLGTTPSRGAGASGSGSPASASRSTPTSNSGTRRTPAPGPTPLAVDPQAETEPHTTSAQTDDSSDHPGTNDSLEAATVPVAARKPRAPEPFDWTPIIVIATLILTMTIGYFVLKD
jgi:serine/threonine protein kinase